jgi:hypothetical protein
MTVRGPITIPANVAHAQGRTVNFETFSAGIGLDTSNKNLIGVRTTGTEDSTLSEVLREAAILYLLQNPTNIADKNPWINALWFTSDATGITWPPQWSQDILQKSPPAYDSEAAGKILNPLNSSQKTAVHTMLSRKDSDRFTIIQGPPGTGKTSVIAAYVRTIMTETQGRPGIWYALFSCCLD